MASVDDEISTMNINESVAEETKTRRSALLRGFNKALTAVTVCGTGGNEFYGGETSCICPSAAADLAKAADQEAQKIMNLLAQRMTVSKAIIDDVEVLTMLIERLFA
ncbi:expressed unknown protein [Seminavis robusta]|uniref:Uncharacterized protein n=1 Tax=Seminavis robusta TaxID=568900 RepID=A0A9N8HDI3_9STRA|nr:expressed unknown protein [Seminavis robusta]|eukprot:Sro461_g147790.1 n/a (107) ;mRNA; f:38478-38798